MLADTLRIEMKKQGLTQCSLASISGITEAALSQVLSGQRNLSVKSLLKVCTGLGMTPNDLLGFHSDKKHKLRSEIAVLKNKLVEIESIAKIKRK